LGDSLTKLPPKGYEALSAVDLAMDGRDLNAEMRERGEGLAGRPEQGNSGGAPWPPAKALPELSVRALRNSISRTNCSGRERGGEGELDPG